MARITHVETFEDDQGGKVGWLEEVGAEVQLLQQLVLRSRKRHCFSSRSHVNS